MDRKRLELLLTGLAAGDSLGSTSEFVRREDVPAVYEAYRGRGWPFRQVGGGAFNWRAGGPTDDTRMALCIVRSFLRQKRFDGADVAAEFVKWLEGNPPKSYRKNFRHLAWLCADKECGGSGAKHRLSQK